MVSLRGSINSLSLSLSCLGSLASGLLHIFFILWGSQCCFPLLQFTFQVLEEGFPHSLSVTSVGSQH